MKRTKSRPILFVTDFAAIVPFSAGTALGAGSLQPVDLRCEYLVDPLGIDVVKPRLSWILQSEARSRRQTSYQVLVASSQTALDKDQGNL